MAINLNPQDSSQNMIQNALQIAQQGMNDIHAIQNDLQSSMDSIRSEVTDLKAQVSNLNLTGGDAARQNAMIGSIDSILIKIDAGTVSFNQIMGLISNVKTYLGQVVGKTKPTGTPLTDLSQTGFDAAIVTPLGVKSKPAINLKPVSQKPMPTQLTRDIFTLTRHTTYTYTGPLSGQIAADQTTTDNALNKFLLKNKDVILFDLNALIKDVGASNQTTIVKTSLTLLIEEMQEKVKAGIFPQDFKTLIAIINQAFA